MRYCITCGQPKEYIQKADEIFVHWHQRSLIIDLVDINPNAYISLECPVDQPIDDSEETWNDIAAYKVLTKDKFFLCGNHIEDFNLAFKHDIPFYSTIPVKEPALCNALIAAGYAAIRVSGELAHRMDYLNSLPVEIRFIINSSNTYMGANSMKGSFIRPEDLVLLADDPIDVCEFYSNSAKEEQALYRIYAEDKEWRGELYMLVKDLEDKEILNRMIPFTFQERRNNCGLKCEVGGYCNYCNIIGTLAKKETFEGVKLP